MALNSSTAPSFVASRDRDRLRERVLWLLVIVPILLMLPMIYQIGYIRSWYLADSPEAYQPLVPLGALILVWTRRQRIAAAALPLPATEEAEREEMEDLGIIPPERLDRSGTLWLAAFGCLLLLLNHLWRYQEVSVVALVTLAAGAASYLYGPRMLRALRAPLCFLLLMAPLPHLITSHTSQMLQVNSSQFTGNILQLIHVPVKVEGNTLLFPHYQLQVTAACGGLGILLALQILTIWLLLLLPTSAFQRITLFSLVTILTLFANLLRLTAMGLLAQSLPDLATRLHDANSWLFTLLLFLLTCGIARRLEITPPWNLAQPTPKRAAD